LLPTSPNGADDAPNHIKHLLFSVGKEITAPDGSSGRILIQDTWNTSIIDELAPQRGDITISKHRYSGFYETTLDTTLRDRREVSCRYRLHDERVR
jgi:ureidoacrylate peracid hydrolase